MKPTHALALVFAASATFGLPAQAQQGWWGDGGAWGPFGMFGQGQGPGIMQGWSGGPMPGQGYGMMPGYPQGGQGYGMMPGPMMGGAMMPGRGQFAMVDSDQDGTVSAEEAAAHADTVFSAMDADDDGALTSNEFMAARMGPGAGLNPAMEARMQAMKQGRFAPMDTNADGNLSKEEFMAAAKAHFDSAGQDGVVTPWSYRSRNWN